jgi:hypothetical protein
MYKLAATRFNTKTWKENESWRQQNNHVGCIYGTPMQIKDNIGYADVIFILEMNNDENKILGIGAIKKNISVDKYYRIYSDSNYNRYTYKSQYRIDMSELQGYNKAIVEMFDTLLFKTKKHIKRAQGITELPEWILKNKHINFTHFFRALFQEYFPAIYTEKKEP